MFFSEHSVDEEEEEEEGLFRRYIVGTLTNKTNISIWYYLVRVEYDNGTPKNLR